MIYFQLQSGGMINQLMNIELAVGIAHESKSEIIVYSNNDEHLYSKYLNVRNFLTPTDSLALGSRPDKNISVHSNIVSHGYWKCSDGKDEEWFAEGRVNINTAQDMHVVVAFGWYSRFFFNRSVELDLALSKVVFKEDYYQFSEMVANYLGDFVGGHVRLLDHITLSKINEGSLVDGVGKLIESNLPVVLCTDEIGHKMIQNNKDKVILLDDIILKEFKKEFWQLPQHGDGALAIVSNIIMHSSKKFIGTFGSTYSSYIQRNRNQKGLNETWSYWGRKDDVLYSPFSWNGVELDNAKKAWQREWPESKLAIGV